MNKWFTRTLSNFATVDSCRVALLCNGRTPEGSALDDWQAAPAVLHPSCHQSSSS